MCSDIISLLTVCELLTHISHHQKIYRFYFILIHYIFFPFIFIYFYIIFVAICSDITIDGVCVLLTHDLSSIFV